MLVLLYALSMFVSAALLFIVQPMVARLLLPTLGGSSAVWTTCLLFFQALLLGGYAYAHLGARHLGPRTQAALHVPLMLAAVTVLPISLPELGMDPSHSPVLWVLAALLLAVGLPFFVVSASAPLLQHWFAHTGHPDADDPYHLYAASNLGSMTALLGYPFLIEPRLGVRAQTVAWAVVYGVFVALTIGCAWRVRDQQTTRAKPTRVTTPLPWAKRVRWAIYALVPSSLMLGVTGYLTTDIAAVPLLWVLPLALYLATFIFAFAKRRVLLHSAFRLGLPLLAIAVLIATALKALPMSGLIAAHLSLFFLFALFFHGELARERPDPAYLTEFFLILSIGGALGGAFNAIVAPTIFDRALDYHVMVAVAVALIAPAAWRVENRHGNAWVVPTVLLFPAAYYLWAMDVWTLRSPETLLWLLGILIPTFLLAIWRPRLGNVSLGIVILAGAHFFLQVPGIISYERSFFASYKVFKRTYRDVGAFVKLSHGTTTHGAQSLDPATASEPVSYQHREGPVGQVLEQIPHERVLVVGLGAGGMAAYAHADAHFDFFEIDPLVEEIAREHFTFLELCGEHCSVEIGDGRNLIAAAADETWDIIFLDAYNSDAVPTHLLTSEALQLYLTKLKPGGVLVFHVSNRYLDIEGVVGSIVADAGLVSRTQLHIPPAGERRRKQIDASKYTVVARAGEDLGPIQEDERWRATRQADVVWTDDFTNVISVFD